MQKNETTKSKKAFGIELNEDSGIVIISNTAQEKLDKIIDIIEDHNKETELNFPKKSKKNIKIEKGAAQYNAFKQAKEVLESLSNPTLSPPIIKDDFPACSCTFCGRTIECAHCKKPLY